ncbi:MAG: hypothetical protein ACXVWU_08120 [Nocardioides sp.]
MRTTQQGLRVDPGAPEDSSLRRAWIGVVTIPLFFMLAFAAGQGMYALLGYKPENLVPLWVDVVAAVPTVAVFLVPCVAAVLYGVRAERAGDRRALVPAAIGALAGLGVLVLTVVTTVAAHV